MQTVNSFSSGKYFNIKANDSNKPRNTNVCKAEGKMWEDTEARELTQSPPELFCSLFQAWCFWLILFLPKRGPALSSSPWINTHHSIWNPYPSHLTWPAWQRWLLFMIHTGEVNRMLSTGSTYREWARWASLSLEMHLQHYHPTIWDTRDWAFTWKSLTTSQWSLSSPELNPEISACPICRENGAGLCLVHSAPCRHISGYTWRGSLS